MDAMLMDVKRFAVHDGPGIRTTLFLKGCSLKCIWCHNPEGIGTKPQMAYYEHKCIGCGECVSVCAQGAQKNLFSRSMRILSINKNRFPFGNRLFNVRHQGLEPGTP